MKIELLNVGPFKHTNLTLGDITIFAGENDTGKSYLNKLLFVIFKISQVSFNNSIYGDLENFNYQMIEQLNEWFSQFKEYHQQNKEKPFYQAIRKFLDIIDFEILNIERQNQEFFNKISSQEISEQSASWKKLFIDFSDKWQSISTCLNKINENLGFLNDEINKLKVKQNYHQDYFASKNKISDWKFLILRIDEIFTSEIRDLLKLNNENDNIKDFLLKEIFEQNFAGETIKNKKYLDETSKVVVKKSEANIFEFSIDKDLMYSKFKYHEKIFNEVTYIEDFYKHLKVTMPSSKFRYNYHFFHRFPVIQISKYHYEKDLKIKIVDSQDLENEKPLTFIANKKSAFDMINEVFKIKNTTYEKEKFKKGAISFKINNSSRGLQTVAALKKIIATNIFFLENSLVIIDEPESYLHPYWQYCLIEILLELAAKHHYKLIISTHSPYFIETLYSFSQNKFKTLNFKFNHFFRNENDDIEITNEEIPETILDSLNYPFAQLDLIEFRWSDAE